MNQDQAFELIRSILPVGFTCKKLTGTVDTYYFRLRNQGKGVDIAFDAAELRYAYAPKSIVEFRVKIAIKELQS